MSNSIDTSPVTRLATLLTFEWGSSVAKYVRWSTAYSDFAPIAAIEVEYGDQHGGVKDVPAVVTMPSDLDPLPFMKGQRYDPTTVTIEELDPSDPATRRVTFKGRVGTVRFDKNGKMGVAEIQVSGFKSLLDVSLGLQILSTCQWVVGTSPCGVDLEPLKKTAVVASITGSTLKVSAGTAPVLVEDFRWHWGTVTVEGLTLTVRYWKSGTDFLMLRPPPSQWVGKTATFTPGCDYTITSCRRLGSEQTFSGMGVAMPDRHPQFEEGDDA